ncbi:MAG: ferredoxin--NADP reductase [Pseudomonadota bacterium]
MTFETHEPPVAPTGGEDKPAPRRPSKGQYLETVTHVHHWSDKLFSLRTTRPDSLRFENGQFVMLGMEVNDRPLLRAYSIASPNYAEHLEFFSIKVPDGALTSRLQKVKVGDTLLISRKPVGTLILTDLKPGKRLFLFATGTGLAPFLSTIQDLEAYERFDDVILVHGVRRVCDLAYRNLIETQLPNHEYLGDMISAQLRYLPLVTREPFPTSGHIPDLINSGRLCELLGIAPLDPATDRAMLCGSIPMLADTQKALDDLGFEASPSSGVAGDYVIERAFVEK